MYARRRRRAVPPTDARAITRRRWRRARPTSTSYGLRTDSHSRVAIACDRWRRCLRAVNVAPAHQKNTLSRNRQHFGVGFGTLVYAFAATAVLCEDIMRMTAKRLFWQQSHSSHRAVSSIHVRLMRHDAVSMTEINVYLLGRIFKTYNARVSRVSYCFVIPVSPCCVCSPEMCSTENIVGAKLMLAGVKLPVKSKEEPLLKEDTLERIKQTKGSSLKQASHQQIVLSFTIVLNDLSSSSTHLDEIRQKRTS